MLLFSLRSGIRARIEMRAAATGVEPWRNNGRSVPQRWFGGEREDTRGCVQQYSLLGGFQTGHKARCPVYLGNGQQRAEKQEGRARTKAVRTW